MKRMCCVCQRTERGGEWWLLPAPAEAETVTHGYCPDCHAQVMAEIRRFSQHRSAESQVGQNMPWGAPVGAGVACV